MSQEMNQGIQESKPFDAGNELLSYAGVAKDSISGRLTEGQLLEDLSGKKELLEEWKRLKKEFTEVQRSKDTEGRDLAACIKGVGLLLEKAGQYVKLPTPADEGSTMELTNRRESDQI